MEVLQRTATTDVETQTSVTYYTVSDHRFFLGTIALLNSLHVTGNGGEHVVLDTGLTSSQRAFLSAGARVVTVDAVFQHPILAKGFASTLKPTGVVVLIDSDMIVTGSLADYFTLARGRMCAYSDLPVNQRWFPEWEPTLQLRAPLRRNAPETSTYVSSGFVILDTDHWPTLLERFVDVCRRIPPDTIGRRSPFKFGDQDALNALRMSEFPEDMTVVLPEQDWAFGGDARIEDIYTLACNAYGERKILLHYGGSPKPWQQRGWLRLAGRDYVLLMKRLLFADDVPLRIMTPDRVPIWLRPTRSGNIALRSVRALNAFATGVAHRLPDRSLESLRRLRRRIAN